MSHTVIDNRSSGVIRIVSNTTIRVFDLVYNWFAAVSKAQSRTDVIERMNQMTDEELSARYNIKRDQIVNYVFADKMY